MKKLFKDTYPELMKEYDVSNTHDMSKVSFSSAKRALWNCLKCSYTWDSSFNNRSAGRGCPACAGRVLVVGLNDLASIRPDALSWWDDERDPYLFMNKSRTEVQWKCPRGHNFMKTIKKFNFYCSICSKGSTVFSYDKTFAALAPKDMLEQWSDSNEDSPRDYSYNSAKVVEWKCKKGHIWSAPIYSRFNGTGCSRCKSKSSKAERELADFIESLLEDNKNVTVVRNDRRVLNGKELDVLIPELNIAFEYNGLFWHSDRILQDKNYHYDKWKACQDQGIQLITVWEDDWRQRREIVENTIRHKLGVSNQDRVAARKTTIQEVSYRQSAKFLNLNHIQGDATGSKYVALVFDNEIVAIGVFKLSQNVLSLERYATSRIVVGGLGKILKYARTCYNFIPVTTFASHDISDGNLYRQLGFVEQYETPPDYMYVVNGERVHKFNYRLARFKKDPTLRYVEGFSENELAILNGIEKAWDNGKTKFILK